MSSAPHRTRRHSWPAPSNWAASAVATSPPRRCARPCRKRVASYWKGGFDPDERFYGLDPDAHLFPANRTDGGLVPSRATALHRAFFRANGPTMPESSGGPAVPASNAVGISGRTCGGATGFAAGGIHLPHVALRFDAGVANADGTAAQH